MTFVALEIFYYFVDKKNANRHQDEILDYLLEKVIVYSHQLIRVSVFGFNVVEYELLNK